MAVAIRFVIARKEKQQFENSNKCFIIYLGLVVWMGLWEGGHSTHSLEQLKKESIGRWAELV